MPTQIDTLRFPSGISVARAKKDAKRLRKVSGIPQHQALNETARANGINLPWDKAIRQLLASSGEFLAPDTPAMLRSDIEALLEQHKDLTRYGWWNREYGDEYNESRGTLLESLDECNRALRFLVHTHPIASINRGHSSYGLKHQAEHFNRQINDGHGNQYISNGAFICAALHRGYVLKRVHISSPNVNFNISNRSDVYVWRYLTERKGFTSTTKNMEKLADLEEMLGITEANRLITRRSPKGYAMWK